MTFLRHIEFPAPSLDRNHVENSWKARWRGPSLKRLKTTPHPSNITVQIASKRGLVCQICGLFPRVQVFVCHTLPFRTSFGESLLQGGCDCCQPLPGIAPYRASFPTRPEQTYPDMHQLACDKVTFHPSRRTLGGRWVVGRGPVTILVVCSMFVRHTWRWDKEVLRRLFAVQKEA